MRIVALVERDSFDHLGFWMLLAVVGWGIYQRAWAILIASGLAFAVVLVLIVNRRGAAIIRAAGWIVTSVAVYLTGWVVVRGPGVPALLGLAVWALLFAAIGYLRGRAAMLYGATAFVFFILGGLVLLLVPVNPEVASERRRRLSGHRDDRVECRHCARLVPVDQEFCRCGNRVNRLSA